ncbi:MAG: S-adenosyl-L-methionine-dependent methyltransferase MraW [Parcubacteria group bacterium GW2011_GWB1_57_6]|nr:MAG: S-adenosyl-L-methionine-dependent methyltransferase MraW [Parcubacteria group bacterium GW2011_GWA1_56_13]KKW46062.1 MAG: S-adenosyl-L-methionine-dependent methyltransferase MraW [Parcubacteria group bacterium GW2011_GWB1_57_6]
MSEVLQALAVQPGDTVVDATIGGAGHFAKILAALGEGGIIIGIDADPGAVERGREAYAADRRPERPVAHLVNDNFRNLARILERLGIGSVNAIVFDLGWSGYQIAAPRGFSFSAGGEEPLLMTYGLPARAGESGPSAGLGTGQTAADIVNSFSEAELADLIFTFGDERFARSIAHAIVAARSSGRILTTGALVAAIQAGTPAWYQRKKIHPATKTFQALRIAVNDEIAALREGLAAALHSLAQDGRLVVISFHSIEDRVVKNILRDAVRAGLGSVSPKKPIVPARSEILANRRARSAKLRVFRRSAAPLSTYA